MNELLRGHGERDDFLGHIGGDDFVIVVRPAKRGGARRSDRRQRSIATSARCSATRAGRIAPPRSRVNDLRSADVGSTDRQHLRARRAGEEGGQAPQRLGRRHRRANSVDLRPPEHQRCWRSIALAAAPALATTHHHHRVVAPNTARIDAKIAAQRARLEGIHAKLHQKRDELTARSCAIGVAGADRRDEPLDRPRQRAARRHAQSTARRKRNWPGTSCNSGRARDAAAPQRRAQAAA